MPEKNVVQTVHDTLWDEMKADDRVMVMGEDVGARGGVFRATAGFLEEFGEMRVLDTPLAESSIVGCAIGMAMHGLLPVAEIQFADFIHPAFDQLVSEAARIRYRTAGDWSCPMVVRAPYGGGVHGALYHSQSIEAFYGHVPGLKTVLPATPYDVKGMLRAAIRDPDPVLFLEHKKTYRFHPHTSDDDDRTYRSREEVEEAKRNDPLIVFAGYLKDQGLLDDDGVESLRAEVKANVDQEADAAWNAPDPEPEDALRHVFADAASAAMGARAGDQGNEKADAFESTGGEATPAESPRSEPGGEG